MIQLNIPNGNLGDTVLTTSLFKNNREGIITILDVTETRRLEHVFYGFNVKIQYATNIGSTIINNNKTHICQQYLDHFRITDSNCIPKININPEDLKWAREYVSRYPNPLVVVTNNGGTGDPTNYWSHYRTFNPILMNDLLQEYAKKYTLLHFGLSRDFNKDNYRNDIESFIPMPNCVNILDLPISKLAACYKMIGKYIGGDTGDYHLMLAVGGKCNVLVNQNHDLGYPHKSYLYSDDLWKDERVRIRYIPFQKYEKSLDYIDFNY